MRRRPWLCWCLTGAGFAVGGEMAAQELPRLVPGVPVRLVAPTPAGPRVYAGGLVWLTYDSVSIVQGLRPQAFALRTLERFAINRGRPRAVMIGAPLLGAAMGALLGATSLGPPAGCEATPEVDRCAWETSPLVVGIAGGAVLFAIVTQLLVPEYWQEIPIDVLVGRSPLAVGR